MVAVCSERKELTDRFGVFCADELTCLYHCPDCEQRIPETVRLPHVSYNDFASLIQYGIQLCLTMAAANAHMMEALGLPQPQWCDKCATLMEPYFVEHWLFNTVLQKDLIVRYHCYEGARTDYTTLFYDGESEQCVDFEMLASEKEIVARDALMRAVALSAAHEDDVSLNAAVKAILTAFAEDTELPRLVPHVLDRQQFALAEALATAFSEHHPEDPEADFWLGEVLYNSVLHGHAPESYIELAEQHFCKSLVALEDEPLVRQRLSEIGRRRAGEDGNAVKVEQLLGPED